MYIKTLALYWLIFKLMIVTVSTVGFSKFGTRKLPVAFSLQLWQNPIQQIKLASHPYNIRPVCVTCTKS